MFKQNAVKRTVTATFQKPDGTPSEGSVILKLDKPVLGRQENTIYSRQGVEIELDASGSFSKDLVVTSPGLTSEEAAELAVIEQQVQSKISQLETAQEAINVYIEKISNGQTITPSDKIAYEQNQTLKRELQLEIVDLSQQNKVFDDKIKQLEKNLSVMTIHCKFSNPRDQTRIRLVIPPGDGPIDIADLPREE